MKQIIGLSLLFLFASFSFAKESEPSASDNKSQLAGLKAHFPQGLIDVDGKPVPFETLEGKVVGIYFSAAWCGPCRRFTPVLFEYRNKYKDDFQVVFVSSDTSDVAQASYMKKNKMDCPTIKRGAVSQALSQKYQVQGIPSLVLLDHKGTFFTREGRGIVSIDLDMGQIVDGKTRIEVEEYLCGRCDKIHTRPKLIADDPKEAAKLKY